MVLVRLNVDSPKIVGSRPLWAEEIRQNPATIGLAKFFA